jgi:valyl-tRNA synthetase
MIMAGLEFHGTQREPGEKIPESEIPEKIPFRDVYFTGIIRDEKGRKMSKSLGNSPDPLDLIAKYGADGLRHGIMSIAPKGQDIRFSEERIEQGRNFCNKLWNVSRFRTMTGELGENNELSSIIKRINKDVINDDDHAILLQLAETLNEVERLYGVYEFNAVLQTIYRFFWNDFCDWYIEVSKSRLADEKSKATCLAVQDICIRHILLLLHPVTPFITEELWTLLAYSNGNSIQGISPGTGDELISDLENAGIKLEHKVLIEMQNVRELVTSMRALKADRNLSNNKDVGFLFLADNEKADVLRRYKNAILTTVGASALDRTEDQQSGMPTLITDFGSIYLDLSTGIDLDAEKARLEKEVIQLEKNIKSGRGKLSNEAFTSKAPEQIIEGARKQLEENEAKLKETMDALNALKA